MEKIKKYEIWGVAFSVIIGTLLHFVFDWSGQSHFAALIGTVNESTWEHLKIAFWPTFIFSIIEWFIYGREIKNFFYANFLKLFSIPIIIIALFFLWLAYFPDSLIYDIFIFVIAIILGYHLSYKTIKNEKTAGPETIWIILILLELASFSLFSFRPPKNILFMDLEKDQFGIERTNQ